MMHLIFDTETSGKWDYRAPDDAAHQPRMVQLGAILADDDARVFGEINLIVKPEGFVIGDEVAALHGITQDIALRLGVPLLTALGAFSQMVAVADVAVAFNIEFDLKIIAHECALLKKPNRLATTTPHCVMKQMTPICKLPKPASYRNNPDDPYKWPNLAEAYQYVFSQPFAGTAHNAMEDVRACGRIYYAMLWKSRETGVKLAPGVANTNPQQSLI